MTLERTNTPAPGGRAHRGTHVDSYDDIEPWFDKLRSLPESDPQRGRIRDHILRLCLPLAEHIARNFTGRGQDYEDLLQVARLGLVLSVDRFDPAQGSSFLAFAVPTITGEVRRHFRDHGWVTHVPRPTKELQRRIGPATEVLAQRLRRMPTSRELAAELGVETTEITMAMIAGNTYRCDPLEKCVTADNDDDRLEWAAPLSADEPGYNLVEEVLTIRPLLQKLPERDRWMLRMRYGRGLSQAEIGSIVGMSQMRVSRTLARIITGLRNQALSGGIPSGSTG